MSAWIKVDHLTPSKEETLAIAVSLGIDVDTVVGKLIRLWIWFDQHTSDFYAPRATPAQLDRHLGATGFTLETAKQGWLVIGDGSDDALTDPNTPGIRMVNPDAHMSQTAKSRALAANRMQKIRRATQAQHERNESVTKSKSKNKNMLLLNNNKGGVGESDASVTEALPDRCAPVAQPDATDQDFDQSESEPSGESDDSRYVESGKTPPAMAEPDREPADQSQYEPDLGAIGVGANLICEVLNIHASQIGPRQSAAVDDLILDFGRTAVADALAYAVKMTGRRQANRVIPYATSYLESNRAKAANVASGLETKKQAVRAALARLNGANHA